MIKLPKSNKLNRRHVFLAFRTKLTRIRARLNANIGGTPVSYMAVVMWDNIDEQYKMYGLKWGEDTVVELNWSRINKNNFLLLNTKYNVSDLEARWKNKLLRQKARHIDRLFIRCRCVKCLRPILDRLQQKWNYKFGDIFASVYLKRRIKHGKK